MTVEIILNPTAGGGRAARNWAAIETELVAYSDLTLHRTEAPGHALELARAAVARGVDRIIAVGGDGTVQEVVNGMARSAASLGIVPLGSGNDFAHGLDIPRDPALALRLALTGQPRRIDLGRVHDRYFTNVGGVGFDAQVAARANTGVKRRGGYWPYVAALLRELLALRTYPLELQLEGEQPARVTGRMLLVAVGIGQSYGGGMRICPRADFTDGLIDLCVASDVGRFEVLALLPRVFRGTHLDHPKVSYLRTSRLTVHGPAHLAVHADGEIVGNLPVTFEVIPGGLPVIAGKTT